MVDDTFVPFKMTAVLIWKIPLLQESENVKNLNQRVHLPAAFRFASMSSTKLSVTNRQKI